MKFSFNLHNFTRRGELLYIQSEYSLCYKPFSTNVGMEILCGAYTGLDTICETCEVIHLSGLSPKGSWIEKKLEVPRSLKGDLFVHFDDPPIKGVAIEYDRNWNTYYDKSNDYICIGNPDTAENSDCIEFANGVIAVLKDGRLTAVWGKIREAQL